MQQQYTEQLLQSRLEIQEQTFTTISQEIHDNVGQTLSLAKVQMNIIEQKETMDTAIFTEAKANISRAMTDLRDIARSLNTDRITLESLPQTVAQEVSRINRAGIIAVAINITGEEVAMPNQKKLIIYRMVQESLQNILKHAAATQVTIQFLFEAAYLQVLITDNGTGFNTQKLTPNNAGLGLQNIVHRAMLIGGNATITSAINKGTTITITSPYA